MVYLSLIGTPQLQSARPIYLSNDIELHASSMSLTSRQYKLSSIVQIIRPRSRSKLGARAHYVRGLLDETPILFYVYARTDYFPCMTRASVQSTLTGNKSLFGFSIRYLSTNLLVALSRRLRYRYTPGYLCGDIPAHLGRRSHSHLALEGSSIRWIYVAIAICTDTLVLIVLGPGARHVISSDIQNKQHVVH